MRIRLVLALALLAVVTAFLLRARMGDRSATAPSDGAAATSSALDVEALPGTAPSEPAPVFEETGTAREAVGAAPSPAPAAPENDRSLRVRVIGPAGQPVAGARLELSRAEADEYQLPDSAHNAERRLVARGASDERGEASFELPPGLPHQLEVSAAGLAVPRESFCYGGQHVVVRLEPASRLVGRVTRVLDGSLVAGATVSVWPRPRPGRPHPGNSRRETETGPDGAYAFDGLAPGPCYLDVDPPIDAPPRWIEIDLLPGQTLERPVAVEPGITVSGRVTDAATGLPIAGAVVSEGWTFRRTVRADADGRYVFPGFSASRLALHARAPGYGEAERLATHPSGSAVSEGMDLALQPARRAFGRVVNARGAPVAGAYVAAVANEYDPTSSRFPEQRLDWRSTSSAADGTFALADLRADMRHTLFAKKEGFGAVAYDFPPDESLKVSIDLGDVPLPPASGVSGELMDDSGAPVAGHGVRLVGLNADRGRWGAQENPHRPSIDSFIAAREAVTDHRGRFRFVDVAPGTYEVVVQRPSSHATLRAPIEVGIGADVKGVKLVVPRGASIAGRVVVSGGGILPKVYVSVDPQNGGSYGDVEVDAEGRFVATGLTGASYALTAYPYALHEDRLAGRLFDVARVAGVTAGREDVVIELKPKPAIRVLVLDSTGRPVEGARIVARGTGGAELASQATGAGGRCVIHLPGVDRADLEARPPGAHPPPATFASLPGALTDGSEQILRLPWRP